MFEGEQQVGHGVINVILDEAHLLNITVKPPEPGLPAVACWPSRSWRVQRVVAGPALGFVEFTSAPDLAHALRS